VEEPLEKLKTRMANRNLKFSLKNVSIKTGAKTIKSVNKKKSAGIDELSQGNLILGTEVLKIPLTRLINNSIGKGEFSEPWKEAVVTPILKRGSPGCKENYRPVSCLNVASKVLEKIVCEQITKHMESHGLLSENQHGFRSKRPTMTALTAMQNEWVKNTEEERTTGILLWDLSASYDTLDTELFCKKLRIYLG
jgi:hypothetical protein